jgi:sugar lactone lactonase YvrE
MRFPPLFPALLAGASLAHAGGVYWTDRGADELKRMGFDGSGLQTIQLFGTVSFPGSNLRGVAVDQTGNRLFWADNGSDSLLRANLDGSDSVIVTTITGGNSFPADVRLDLTAGHLFWCDQTRNRIQRSSLDGTDVIDVTTNAAPSGPYFMDLDVEAGKIYWGDFDVGAIYRANLDGSSRETLLTGNNKTRGVRVDPAGGMLYWINRDDKKIHRCPLSAFAGGTIPLTDPAVQTLYTGLDTPHGLTLDVAAGKIYWADTGSNSGTGTGDRSVSRGDLDGSTPLEVLASGSEPWDVDLDLRCTSYSEWRARFFRRDAPPAQTAPNADPDGDGLPNAVEYAHGLPPLRSDRTGLPEGILLLGPTPGVPYAGVKFRRQAGAADLTTYFETSGDLTNWTGTPANPPTTTVTVTSLDDGLEEVTVRSLAPISTDPQFLRLVIALTQ